MSASQPHTPRNAAFDVVVRESFARQPMMTALGARIVRSVLR